MLIIPAIDLKEGKCVRLKQGKMKQAHVYFEDPLECAQHWLDLGAERLHIVDLDGAVEGKTMNAAIIKNLRTRYPNIELQIGGGIRQFDTARYYLDVIGTNFIILSTYAIEEPSEAKKIIDTYPDTVFLGLDIAEGTIYTSGWLESSELSYHEVIDMFTDSPLAGIVVTDIERDGMLQGINLSKVADFCRCSPFPVIVAGGVKNIEDIHRLKEVDHLAGVICGKSLYEKSLDFMSANEVARAG